MNKLATNSGPTFRIKEWVLFSPVAFQVFISATFNYFIYNNIRNSAPRYTKYSKVANRGINQNGFFKVPHVSGVPLLPSVCHIPIVGQFSCRGTTHARTDGQKCEGDWHGDWHADHSLHLQEVSQIVLPSRMISLQY